jgi:uncharacterized protein (DUF3084 family)
MEQVSEREHSLENKLIKLRAKVTQLKQKNMTRRLKIEQLKIHVVQLQQMMNHRDEMEVRRRDAMAARHAEKIKELEAQVTRINNHDSNNNG